MNCRCLNAKCSFRTKFKTDLKYHSIKHNSLNGVSVYKCEKCSFRMKYKHGFKSHFFKHKSINELHIIVTNVHLVRNLKNQMKIHTSLNELLIYK